MQIKEQQKRVIRQIGIILAAAVILSNGVGIKQKIQERKEKARQEKRANEFAEYIFEDIKKIVEQNITQEDIDKFTRIYEMNLKLYNKYIKELAEDSAAYAELIIRDAAVINKFDKNMNKVISFEEAIKIIENVKEPEKAFDRSHKDYDEKSLHRNRSIQSDINTRLAVARKVKQAKEKEKR